MRTALLITLIGAVAACSSAPAPSAKPPPKPCPPANAEFRLSATAHVNPSPEGEGRPVQVRVYQLVSDTRLRNSTLEAILQNEKDVLRADLKSVREYTVFPGKPELVSIKPHPEAHVVALVAVFREPQGNNWFVTYELGPPPSPPQCAAPEPIPVLLDRMQIQDGEGQGDLGEQVQEPTLGGSVPNENEPSAEEKGAQSDP